MQSETTTYPPILGLLENTLIDWEGKIACEVFLPRCNMHCRICHAKHLITEAPILESIPPDAITELLDRHKGWIDGVVISGGEPTIHKNLDKLIELFRSHGALIKLDTNGLNPDALESLLKRKLLDAISMDIKAPLDYRYSAAAGCDIDTEKVKRSISLIMNSGLEYEFRTTVCPALIGLDELREIAEEIRGAKKYILQQFHPGECLDLAMNEVQPYPREKLIEFAESLCQIIPNCSVRGQAK